MNNMIEKIQDKLAEKLLNKIIDNKKIVITIDFKDKGDK
ncbi:hypothetical protein GJ23_gp38 [Lactococcus phage P118]|uniref:Uncharacterized protein n=4 Tax=Nevevirus TaxID=2843430 RepID=X4YUJ1_9CAUD|nr:hypothetical protein GJ20_gp37 [Lactococcus phage P092]YP_009035853.1 hypothetical protein GJ23_gp38 [Lactococcus phage P118]YP_009036784.1 hypothetical protein GJ24_gp41 [Lactococcus phage P162]YP_009036863.1 hypothetical protein GJ21_gp38 [Lactococcus phage P078]AHV83001.1 hypothetical protein P078_0038 [Lactococcus phage P078]AHV83078.1 hypothetical protein P092_0037 [Lactococcus phage P092]AHV83155.1 hypothetical protein P118_0038 [Lactococcus phage P118]AHV83238.1 hypothetical protei